MILEILQVLDQDQETQRLTLKVVADGNLVDYAIVDNTYKQGGALSNLQRHFYSFPDHPVEKDEYVVLYTRKVEIPLILTI